MPYAKVLCLLLLGYEARWSGRPTRFGNFHCQGILLIRIIAGQGRVVLAIDAGGGCFDIFSLLSFLYLSFTP